MSNTFNVPAYEQLAFALFAELENLLSSRVAINSDPKAIPRVYLDINIISATELTFFVEALRFSPDASYLQKLWFGVDFTEGLISAAILSNDSSDSLIGEFSEVEDSEFYTQCPEGVGAIWVKFTQLLKAKDGFFAKYHQ